jgi:ubiquitin-protein ligase
MISISTRGTALTSAILREYKSIMDKPHPDIDVYMNENDITFWKILFKGPDSTPYANGCWLAYMKFPSDYPLSPPEMRMDTPIKHCNINNYGRICHSIFDRNYVPTVKVSLILECVYGLLLNPDVTDPLDTNLALLFYSANGEYEATIMENVKKYASRSRWAWQNIFTGDNEEDYGSNDDEYSSASENMSSSEENSSSEVDD